MDDIVHGTCRCGEARDFSPYGDNEGDKKTFGWTGNSTEGRAKFAKLADPLPDND